MKSRQMSLLVAMVAMVVFAYSAVAGAEEGYPLRAKFPKVKYMTTEELNLGYKKTIIVDVRSKIEYDVIHISKAVHVPVSTANFTKDLAAVRAADGPDPIAFYCNGHTCAKSYEAVEQAVAAGFKNVYAYDAGIYDWVKAYPDRGVLMGSSPVSQNKLISKEAFSKRMIKYADFKAKAEGSGAMVIDIREPFQRKTVPPLPTVRNIPSDRFAELLKKGEFKGKQLLVFDAVGKQVQWIQYYLDMYGYADYYFLAEGVDGAM
ncbi:MAG: rhodanese-like domain-containing protein [Nitrospirota bacterium]|nr:rhodanese-like domain-containing protein [Nitrospirota bacterium]